MITSLLVLLSLVAPLAARGHDALGAALAGVRGSSAASYVLVVQGEERGALGEDTVRSLRRVVHQREVVFPDGVRAVQTEELEGSRRRLVWREFRPDGARTWVAEWDRTTGRSTTTGYGWHRRTHGSLGRSPEAEPPGMGVLELTDLLARGRVGDGAEIALVDPSSASIVDVRVRVEGDVARALRRDGTVVVGCTVGPSGGEDLRWPRGGSRPWRAVERARFEQVAGGWRVPVRPAHEAVLAAVRRGVR